MIILNQLPDVGNEQEVDYKVSGGPPPPQDPPLDQWNPIPPDVPVPIELPPTGGSWTVCFQLVEGTTQVWEQCVQADSTATVTLTGPPGISVS